MRADYPRVTHPCATLLAPKDFHVRLACVKHAASVQSEPESNSPVQICIKIPAWQKSESQRLFLPTRYSLVNEPPEGLRPLPPFSAARCRFMHHTLDRVNNFFSFRQSFFAGASKGPKVLFSRGKWKISIHPPSVNDFLQKSCSATRKAPKKPRTAWS